MIKRYKIKNLYTLVVILVASSLSSFGQGQHNYDLTFDSQSGMQHLFIDTLANPDNVWEVGSPQKSVLNAAYSNPNVIITDSIDPYPPNDTSVFVITNVAEMGGFEMPHTAILAGKYYVNSDTLSDYGKIEFSPDMGNSWIDMLNDTILIDTASNWSWYWLDFVLEKPVLTGNSNGWKSFGVNLAELGHFFGVGDGDTVLYRFTFISDSIQTNKDGLMFDDLHFGDWWEGLQEFEDKLFHSVCFPNPAGQSVTIEATGDFRTLEVEIFDLRGKRLTCSQFSHTNTVKLNVSKLGSGIYANQGLSFPLEISISDRMLQATTIR